MSRPPQDGPGRDLAAMEAEHQANVDRTVTGLRELAAAEVEARAEYEQLVEQSKQRERRIARAITALEGGGPGTKPKPKPKAVQPVGEEVIEAVLATMRQLAAEGHEPVTRLQVVEAMPERSGETVRRGLNELRERQLIRLAGRNGNGRTAARLYAVMPDGD